MRLKYLSCMVSAFSKPVYNAETNFSMVLQYSSKQAKHGML